MCHKLQLEAMKRTCLNRTDSVYAKHRSDWRWRSLAGEIFWGKCILRLLSLSLSLPVLPLSLPWGLNCDCIVIHLGVWKGTLLTAVPGQQAWTGMWGHPGLASHILWGHFTPVCCILTLCVPISLSISRIRCTPCCIFNDFYHVGLSPWTMSFWRAGALS